jgi:hypothetical protein
MSSQNMTLPGILITGLPITEKGGELYDQELP